MRFDLIGGVREVFHEEAQTEFSKPFKASETCLCLDTGQWLAEQPENNSEGEGRYGGNISEWRGDVAGCLRVERGDVGMSQSGVRCSKTSA